MKLSVPTPTRRRAKRAVQERLQPYEAYDETFLPLISEDPKTFDELIERIDDAKQQAVLKRWLASAEWRGLIERHDPTPTSPRTYVRGLRSRETVAA